MHQPRAFTKLVAQVENPVHRREAVELDMDHYEVHRSVVTSNINFGFHQIKKICSLVLIWSSLPSWMHTGYILFECIAILLGLFFRHFTHILTPISYRVFCLTQFRGGATQHGPKPRSHEIGLQKQVRRLGLKVALSSRIAEGKVWNNFLICWSTFSLFRFLLKWLNEIELIRWLLLWAVKHVICLSTSSLRSCVVLYHSVTLCYFFSPGTGHIS